MHLVETLCETKYTRIVQVKFVEYSLKKLKETISLEIF